MKNLLIALLIITSSQVFSQNYKAFNSSSKKLFTEFPEMQNGYSMSFDSVKAFGGDSLYYNFFQIPIDPNFVSDDCDFWGTPDCWKLNMPVWIGSKIGHDNLYNYNFYTNNGDTIHFNFSPVYGDPPVFYQDTLQQFSLIYEGVDTLSVLNYPDSARFFTILHTDLEGNQISSPLNGQSIIIAKELGLTQFFQIDLFPQILNPLQLIGNANPNLGITIITNEMVFDWQPGDEIQYNERYWWTDGPPWDNFIRYRKHSILERTETVDLLKYVIEEQVFYQDSSFVLTDTISKDYSRNQVIAQLPFEVFDGNYNNFYLDDYCEFNLWTFRKASENALMYCDIDNVWGYWDTYGPPDEENKTYTLGLGVYVDAFRDYHGWISESSGYCKFITYFKKNGETCGGEVVVGIEVHDDVSVSVSVNPNPANSIVYFSADASIKQIAMINSTGKMLVSEMPNSRNASFDVSAFPNGVYFATIEVDGQKFVTKKIVVLK